MTKYTPRRREAPPRDVFSHLGTIFDHFEIVFGTKFVKFRTTIVTIRANNCNYNDEKNPIIFHIRGWRERGLGLVPSNLRCGLILPCPTYIKMTLQGSSDVVHVLRRMLAPQAVGRLH